MKKFKYQRKLRKIRKLGKRMGKVLISLAVSYIISLFSFYVYTKLTQLLSAETEGFIGFVLIGLAAGLSTIVVSLISKRFTLTVAISFIIYCVIDTVFMFPKTGITVIQFLPSLLIGMSAVIASWYFLKKRLGLSNMKEKFLKDSKEHVYKECILANKLLEDPNKLTLEMFKEACGLLEGINPKIDAALKKADYIIRALKFLKGDDLIGFVVVNIKVETKEDEEKKEGLLFFIDLVKDISDEVETILARMNTEIADKNTDNPVKQIDRTITNIISTTGGITNYVIGGIITGLVTSVVVAQAAGAVPGSNILPKNNSGLENALYTSSKNMLKTTDTAEKKTIKDILSSGRSTHCTYYDDTYDTTAEYYIENFQNMRIDSVSHMQGKTLLMHYIYDGKSFYYWMEVDGKIIGAMKMISELMNSTSKQTQAVYQAQGLNQPLIFNPGVGSNFKCSPWDVDGSKFVIPSGIEFTDYNSIPGSGNTQQNPK